MDNDLPNELDELQDAYMEKIKFIVSQIKSKSLDTQMLVEKT
jgi:hypothetical protein